MSNPSLKDQLTTLGLSPIVNNKVRSNTSNKKNNSPKQNSSTGENAKKKKPVWLEQAQYGVELLKAYFPACFKEAKEIQPLKIGIKQDLVKYLSTRDEIVIGDKACMVSSLSYYVNSPSYHKHVIEGATRVDLEGNPAGIVTIEEARYSEDCRTHKLQKKKSPAVSEHKTEGV